MFNLIVDVHSTRKVLKHSNLVGIDIRQRVSFAQMGRESKKSWVEGWLTLRADWKLSTLTASSTSNPARLAWNTVAQMASIFVTEKRL